MSAGSAAMIEIEQAARIYVDTNIWIYYVEANPAFLPKVAATLLKANDAQARLVTSELTVAECLIWPSRQDNQMLIALYENFFAEADIEIVGLDGGLACRAALAGGALGLKLIDAIHHTSALEAGCRYFLTGDTRFRSTEALAVIGLE